MEKNTVSPRLKLWISLVKWFIVSVALVVMTRIIDTGFRERQADLADLRFYHEYVTPAIVLNSSPVQKRMLAQYFACISPSAELRERWVLYYDSVYPEYIRFITPVLAEEQSLQNRYLELTRVPFVADRAKSELREIEDKLAGIRLILYPVMESPVYPAP